MGSIYKHAINYLPVAKEKNILVEIGSDRYEGSTEFLANLAKSRDQVLHSIDIDQSASQRIRHQNIVWHHQSGREWCETVLLDLDSKIDLLYLDNFDYDWDISKSSDMISLQKKVYLEKFKIEMNNKNCQIEHMSQAVGCLPYMDDAGVIMCDDTYLWNDCWVGKCGPVVVWLQSQGWILREMFDYGVILTKTNQ